MVAAVVWLAASEGGAAEPPVESLPAETRPVELRFNRDIRPILSDHCFHCHGPDASTRKAGLRLDTREGAVALRRGSAAVVAGHPDQSTLIERIRSDDPEDIMPPPDLKKPLSESQKATLEEWIRRGAGYEGHWAYESLKRPEVPGDGSDAGTGGRSGRSWGAEAIDRFISAELAARGLAMSAEADRRTLYRRLSLDLTGLPPRPGEVEAFAASSDPSAYERAVDGMLASPHYGERMAVFWLDLARYADTVGYHGDQDYSVWPYRDYVIRAFNANMPFDRFTLENLAGDLLPNATRDQRVASAYNRLLMITAEGGAQDREYLAKYAADRVRNTATAWLGVTLGCAECHDHKYDPFTARDFYSFAAFFSDLNEQGFYARGFGGGDWGPMMRLPSEAQAAEQGRLERHIAGLEAVLSEETPELAAARSGWEREVAAAGRLELGPWHMVGPFGADSFDEAYDREFGPERGVDLDAAFAGGALKWQARAHWKDGAIQSLDGENSATYLYRTLRAAVEQDLELSLGSDDALRVWLNGEEVLAKKVRRGAAADQEKPVVRLRAGENGLLMKVVNAGGGSGFYFRVPDQLPSEIVAAAQVPPAERTEEQRTRLRTHFAGVTPLLEETRTALAQARESLKTLLASMPKTLVSEALPEPREVRILRRGNWLDDGGEVVGPAVPHFLPQPAVTDRRLTRRDLAEWITARDNPLTARVMVNRLWKQFFGVGLSKKLEDIGAQGEWPSHPALLDWLACELRDSGWNLKHVVRLMVTSAAYRQSSRSTGVLREVDPDNRWLARQSAFRIDAEFVRDLALSVSGLLVNRFEGPSAKPYQPAGYYAQLNFPKREYEADRDDNQYRRGLYTHWQRTFLHPSLAAFDAPTREECTAERVRSNSPQQALVLLNDPTYVEAARVFAERILREGGTTVHDRLRFAFREALSRPPRPDEFRILGNLLSDHAREYAADLVAAERLLSTGNRPVPADLRRDELAAWTSVARVLLNLHETITRS